jgi:hypothetical protein
MTDFQNNESEFDFENELKYLYSDWELTTIESQILYLTTLKTRYLQSSYSNNLTYGTTFDKKCDLEIELLKSRLEFEPIKEQLTNQPQQVGTNQTNSLNWQGTPLQFTELTKALFETKLVSPEMNQKEFFKRMKLFFNIDDFKEREKLKDIRIRTNTTTPLLNILETSLNNWIKNKD